VAGRVLSRRWNDASAPGEGTRILVTRYRPRGVRREDETWDEWQPSLAPSVALHAAAYGKTAPPTSFEKYAARYREEMTEARASYFVRGLRDRIAGGEDVVLMCSSACIDESRCHRSLLRELVGG